MKPLWVMSGERMFRKENEFIETKQRIIQTTTGQQSVKRQL